MNTTVNIPTWCGDNFLDLNIQKTKEVIFDFRRKPAIKHPLEINNMQIEIVSVYRYLGCMLDNRLSFAQHVEIQVKKASKMLYYVRAMSKLNVTSSIIALFYNSVISSALNYANTIFYGSLTNQLRYELSRPWKICKKLLSDSANLTENETLYHDNLIKHATKIIKDETHPYTYRIFASPQWPSF